MNKKISKESKELLKDLYSQDYHFTTPEGKTFPIPKSGTLGLLALGYQGLIAWRKQKSNASIVKQ
ncbi:MAG: hypothetical protein GQ564_12800 [Bacteroidales bacterium]|nr:hypothetical protein [Bacteroidales bacterium]